MTEDERPKKEGFGRFAKQPRRPISLSEQALVASEPLGARGGPPLVIRPTLEGVNLHAWAKGNRAFVEENLRRHGAVLFRGFSVRTAAQFEQFLGTMSDDLMDYVYGSTPRTLISPKVYTSTEYPAEQSIPLHNEMAYTTRWPMKIWFFCLHPATAGGQTPIADSRKVFARINPAVRERFARKRVMYVRNYGGGIDLPWQAVFETDDKSRVEEFCRAASIQFEWRGGDRLRTAQVCQAVADHPVTGEAVWFNQAHLFHVSALEPGVRESLLAVYGEDGLSRSAYYGDGSPIEESALDEIREAYRQEAVVFPWQQGDILMLDNMLTAHGREPYAGERKVLVGMAEPAGGGGGLG